MSNIVVVGQREEGKTTLAVALGNQRHDATNIFDPRGMIEGVICWGDNELEIAIEEERWKEGPLVYRYDNKDNDAEFTAFCDVLFPPRFTRGGFACIVDEAGRLQSPTYCHPDLDRIVRQHPTKPIEEKVTVIQTMHTLSESCADLRSLIDEYYIFRLTSKGDLEAIEKLTRDEQLKEVVFNLPQHHCVRFLNSRQPEGQPTWFLWDNPEEWHIRATNQDQISVDNPGDGEIIRVRVKEF